VGRKGGGAVTERFDVAARPCVEENRRGVKSPGLAIGRAVYKADDRFEVRMSELPRG
jgi:hypothetical protein